MPQRSTAPIPIAFIYLRVSTARQVMDGVGLDAQEAKCRAHVTRMGWTLGDVFRDEGISVRIPAITITRFGASRSRVSRHGDHVVRRIAIGAKRRLSWGLG